MVLDPRILFDLDRIAITGNAGSGKTHLGQLLACMTRYTYVSLDKIYWEDDSFAIQREPIEAKLMLRRQIDGRKWIAEGVYGNLLHLLRPQALIWLDLSWTDCLNGIERRVEELKHSTEKTAAFVSWAESYGRRSNSTSRKAHLAIYKSHAGPKWRLISRSEIDHFSARMKTDTAR